MAGIVHRPKGPGQKDAVELHTGQVLVGRPSLDRPLSLNPAEPLGLDSGGQTEAEAVQTRTDRLAGAYGRGSNHSCPYSSTSDLLDNAA